jgi:hypothetical protein
LDKEFCPYKILANTCLQYDLCAVDKQQPNSYSKSFVREEEEEEEATLVK